MKIVYFGTPLFSATILRYLLERQETVIAVVTKPDKPKGRSGEPQPSAVKTLAQSCGLPVYQPLKASHPEFADFLKSLGADVFLVVAYSEIFKENLLQMPPLGCINVHASILPKYRGAAPIQRCVMAGEKESGVTIMSMAKELDAGDVLAITKTPIPEDMTAGELSDTLSHLGAKALWEVLQGLKKGKVTKLAQNSSEATFAPKLTIQDGEIHWENPSDTVYNRIRGVTPKPGAWCWVEIKGEKKRLLIKKARREPSFSAPPGMLVDGPGLLIACQVGAISLLELQVEGKKALAVADFLRGISKAQLNFKLKF